jgi:alkylation response protein AidB-like acyl-CoA dehydrogenase
MAALTRLLNRLYKEVHETKLTRQQHVMFRLATYSTLVETGAALCRKAAGAVPRDDSESEDLEYLQLCARINAALSAQEAFVIASEIVYGCGQWSADEARAILQASGFDFGASQTGLLTDMDLLRTRI